MVRRRNFQDIRKTLQTALGHSRNGQRKGRSREENSEADSAGLLLHDVPPGSRLCRRSQIRQATTLRRAMRPGSNTGLRESRVECLYGRPWRNQDCRLLLPLYTGRDEGAYTSEQRVRDAIGDLLSLCCIHKDEIGGVFHQLRSEAPTTLRRLYDYFNRSWIEGRYFSPKDWSVFEMIVRTDNDAEGGHKKWRCEAWRSNMTCYVLDDILFNEVAGPLATTIELVKYGKLAESKSAQQKEKNQGLVDAWEDYRLSKRTDNPLSTLALLRKVKYLTRRLPFVPDCNYDLSETVNQA